MSFKCSVKFCGDDLVKIKFHGEHERLYRFTHLRRYLKTALLAQNWDIILIYEAYRAYLLLISAH